MIWDYLNGTKDSDRVVQVIQLMEQKTEAELATVDLKHICVGITSSDP